MTGEQIGGIVRAVVAVASGYLIAKGVGDAALWQTISGAVASVAVAWWSWKTNKPAA